MLFSEIAVQNVTGFPAAARLPLRPGLNALVSKDTDLFAMLRALFAPGAEDDALEGTGTPRKIALTIVADDGATYRLVRDLQGGGLLLRSDPATRQPVKMSDDWSEIARLLLTIGLPSIDHLRRHAWIAAADLPSRAAARTTAPPSPTATIAAPTVAPAKPLSPDEARRRLPEMQAELARAEAFEQAQDGLYHLQQKLHQLRSEAVPPDDMQAKLNELTASIENLSRVLGSVAAAEAKIRKYPEVVARRDGALDVVRKKRLEYQALALAPPDLNELMRDQTFLFGFLGGLGCIVGGIVLRWSWLVPLDLVPFGVAVVGAWRWVGQVEGADTGRRRLSDLDDLERKVQKQFEVDAAPMEQSMKALGVGSPDLVFAKLDERDRLDARRAALLRELDQRRSDPTMIALDIERQTVEDEVRKHEAFVSQMGFMRETSVIRRELKQVEEFANAVADPLAAAIESASELAGQEVKLLLEGFKDRIAQYFAALTDGRFAGVRYTGPGQTQVVAGNGASGPLSTLPPPDQDLIYLALRLALAERVAAAAKRPIVVDEPSVIIDGAHRLLFLKMLKALGATTQVIVRAFEAPPAGAVDHVASAGTTVA